VNRAVCELRRLGVNAQGVDLVGTTATTRGLDLEGLTHAFIVEIPEYQYSFQQSNPSKKDR